MAAPRSDKIVCAEFAILRMFKTKGDTARCVRLSQGGTGKNSIREME